MRTVIVYESMYGNTRVIADAIGRGLGPDNQTMVVPVAQAHPELLDGADLVVVGGPTHLHGLSRAATRRGAAQEASKPGSGLTMDPGAKGPGLRDWFTGLGQEDTAGAAFDTRLKGPAMSRTSRAACSLPIPAAVTNSGRADAPRRTAMACVAAANALLATPTTGTPSSACRRAPRPGRPPGSRSA